MNYINEFNKSGSEKSINDDKDNDKELNQTEISDVNANFTLSNENKKEEDMNDEINKHKESSEQFNLENNDINDIINKGEHKLFDDNKNELKQTGSEEQCYTIENGKEMKLEIQKDQSIISNKDANNAISYNKYEEEEQDKVKGETNEGYEINSRQGDRDEQTSKVDEDGKKDEKDREEKEGIKEENLNKISKKIESVQRNHENEIEDIEDNREQKKYMGIMGKYKEIRDKVKNGLNKKIEESNTDKDELNTDEIKGKIKQKKKMSDSLLTDLYDHENKNAFEGNNKRFSFPYVSSLNMIINDKDEKENSIYSFKPDNLGFQHNSIKSKDGYLLIYPHTPHSTIPPKIKKKRIGCC